MRATVLVLSFAGFACTDPLFQEIDAINEPNDVAPPLPLSSITFDAPEPGVLDLTFNDPNEVTSAYRIARRQNVGEAYAEIALVAPGDLHDATARIFRDSGLAEDSFYEYRVSVLTPAGESRPLDAGSPTSHNPILAWSGDPVMADACALVLAGTATIDAEFGATPETATAEAMVDGVRGSATLTGVNGTLTDISAHTAPVSWTVEDTRGGSTTLTRDVSLELLSAQRLVQGTPSAAAGRILPEGRQALRPSCASCTGSSADVVAGADHTCVLADSGEVRCWGYNYNSDTWLSGGQLGSGYSERYLFAEAVCGGPAAAPCSADLTATQVAAGSRHSCALSAGGEVRCWGSNADGQLSGPIDAVDIVPYPRPVCATWAAGCTPMTGFTQIAVGSSHSCALSASGEVRCWGSNYYGQLGDPGAADPSTDPVTVCADALAPCTPLSGVVELTAGADHTCALMGSGELRCWGYNSNGELGNGVTAYISALPSAVCLTGAWDGAGCNQGAALTGITSVSAGGSHTCAVGSGGAVLCWGDNWYEGLATGSTEWDVLHPLPVCDGDFTTACTPLTGASQVASGVDFTCALFAGGAVECWGEDYRRAVDDVVWVEQICASGAFDDTTRTCNDGASDTPLLGAEKLFAGGYTACARMTGSGELWCFGWSLEGSFANGTRSSRAQPLPSPACEAGSRSTACTPMTAPSSVSLGSSHLCAVDDGRVVCSGYNGYGQLGIGRKDESDTASPVCADGFGPSCVPLTGVRALSAGWHHTCALMDDTRVMCWGDGSNGRRGDGTDWGPPWPTLVCESGSGESCVPLENVVQVSAGYGHTCVLLASGEARCFGDNDCGALGDGMTSVCATSFSMEPNPVPVCASGQGPSCPPLTGIVQILAANGYSCALRDDGTVYCWGWNELGQLGDGESGTVGSAGDPLFRPRPVPVCQEGSTTDGCTPLVGATMIAGQAFHTCALVAGGEVRCWGENTGGALGHGMLYGQLTRSTRPVPVCATSAGIGCPALNGAISLAAGWDFTCALMSGGGVRCWGWDGEGELGDGVSDWYGEMVANPTDVCAPDPSNSCAIEGPADPLPASECGTLLAGAVALTAGSGHACAMLEDGRLRCWGSNWRSQLGMPDPLDEYRCAPVTVCASGDGPGCANGAELAGLASAACDALVVGVQ